jgi:hypothetical protein
MKINNPIQLPQTHWLVFIAPIMAAFVAGTIAFINDERRRKHEAELSRLQREHDHRQRDADRNNAVNLEKIRKPQ